MSHFLRTRDRTDYGGTEGKHRPMGVVKANWRRGKPDASNVDEVVPLQPCAGVALPNLSQPTRHGSG